VRKLSKFADTKQGWRGHELGKLSGDTTENMCWVIQLSAVQQLNLVQCQAHRRKISIPHGDPSHNILGVHCSPITVIPSLHELYQQRLEDFTQKTVQIGAVQKPRLV
jgi:hypothetical protein